MTVQHQLTKQPYNPNPNLEWVQSPKWVRVRFGGEFIANSRRVGILRESDRTPVYYFPKDDVRMDLLAATHHSTECPRKGTACYWSVKVGERVAEKAAWSYPQPKAEAPELGDYIAFAWEQMDAWFEEDEPVFVHARDPYTRIDTLRSSRGVKINVGTETVAETNRPTLLFETGLPIRYYMPKVDVRMDLLVPSETITRCPYKGEARYYSLKIGDKRYEDLVWYYPYPTTEVAAIANLVCFYEEKVDELYVDGDLQPKPESPWSS
jgi:uncharacterized protein (DUF427 family)